MRFERGKEIARPDCPADGVLPAYKRLDSRHALAVGQHLRLVGEKELIPLQGRDQLLPTEHALSRPATNATAQSDTRGLNNLFRRRRQSHAINRLHTTCCDPRAMRLRRSISAKLTGLVLVSVGLALLVGTGLGLWQELQRYGFEKREALLAQAGVLATATSQAVRTHDTPAALQTLRAVGRMPGVLFADLLDAEGAPVASLGDAIRLSDEVHLDQASDVGVPLLLQLLMGRTVSVSVPVLSAGEQVGTLNLISDTNDLFVRFRQFVSANLIAAGLTIMIGLALSIRLRRSITRPLADLTRTMSNIQVTHDYA